MRYGYIFNFCNEKRNINIIDVFLFNLFYNYNVQCIDVFKNCIFDIC